MIQDITDPIPVEARDNADLVQIDVSLVEHLLTLSPEERIDAHELARELAHDLMQAGKEYYARQSQNPA